LEFIHVLEITITAIDIIGGGVSCFDRGYIDWEKHLFNQLIYDRCGVMFVCFQGFIETYLSLEGNSRDSCGSATDG
jgi:hypothetical protein